METVMNPVITLTVVVSIELMVREHQIWKLSFALGDQALFQFVYAQGK